MTTEPELTRVFGLHVASLRRKLGETRCDPVSLRWAYDNELLAMALRLAAGSAKNCARKAFVAVQRKTNCKP
jgi:hypothetical protein